MRLRQAAQNIRKALSLLSYLVHFVFYFFSKLFFLFLFSMMMSFFPLWQRNCSVSASYIGKSECTRHSYSCRYMCCIYKIQFVAPLTDAANRSSPNAKQCLPDVYSSICSCSPFPSQSLSLSLFLSRCLWYLCNTLFKLLNLLHNLTLEINCKCDSGELGERWVNLIKVRKLFASRFKRAHMIYACVYLCIDVYLVDIAFGDWPAAIC